MAFKIQGIAPPINPSGAYQGLAQAQMAAEMAKAGMLGVVKDWTDRRVQKNDTMDMLNAQYGLKQQMAKAQQQADLQRDAMKAALKSRADAKEQADMFAASEYLTQLAADPKQSPFQKVPGLLKDSLPELRDMTEQDIQAMLEQRNPGVDSRQISRWASAYTKPIQQQWANPQRLAEIRSDMLKRGWSHTAVEKAFEVYGDLPTTQTEALKKVQSSITASARLWQTTQTEDLMGILGGQLRGIQEQEALGGAAGAQTMANPQANVGDPGVTAMAGPPETVPADQVAAGVTPASPKVSRGTIDQGAALQMLLTKPEAWTPLRLGSQTLSKALNGRSITDLMPGMPESGKGVLEAMLDSGAGVDLVPLTAVINGQIRLTGVEARERSAKSRVNPDLLAAINRELNKPEALMALAGMWVGGGGGFADLKEKGQSLVHVKVGLDPNRGIQNPGAQPQTGNPLDEYNYLEGFLEDQ